MVFFLLKYYTYFTFIQGSGWWKYEFCYGKHVNQYHEDKDNKIVINLGNFEENKHANWVDKVELNIWHLKILFFH